MKNISEIDTNFKVKTSIDKKSIKFYDVLDEPFRVYGVFKENGKFRRLPEEVAKSVSEGVDFLHTNTAGGRVRFKTDSPYVAIHANMGIIGKMPHFALTGSAGFDFYIKVNEEQRYINSYMPPYDMQDGYEGIIELGTKEFREITINFPLYSDVKDLYIGLDENAVVESHTPYTLEKPIVYYGSSITQGGCASRPGNAYQAVISRRFDCNFINLGFSGNAKAEKEITDYIKKLDMSVFVYDYDHNAPTVEHLSDTHEKMFKEIRKENPDLPVIFMSRPKFYLDDEEKERFDIIKTTCENALVAGDKNVYFISGVELMTMAGNEGTVDNCHPNDLGFASMAKVLGDEIEKSGILIKK